MSVQRGCWYTSSRQPFGHKSTWGLIWYRPWGPEMKAMPAKAMPDMPAKAKPSRSPKAARLPAARGSAKVHLRAAKVRPRLWHPVKLTSSGCKLSTEQSLNPSPMQKQSTKHWSWSGQQRKSKGRRVWKARERAVHHRHHRRHSAQAQIQNCPIWKPFVVVQFIRFFGGNSSELREPFPLPSNVDALELFGWTYCNWSAFFTEPFLH